MNPVSDNLGIRLASVGDAVIDIPAPEQVAGGLSLDELKVKYAVSVEVNRPVSRVDITVSMSYLLGQTILFAGHLTSCFEVIDLASYIDEEGIDVFQIKNDFFPMLISIAFGTARGYFVREWQGSALAQYPFPMISMDNIQKRTEYRLI